MRQRYDFWKQRSKDSHFIEILKGVMNKKSLFPIIAVCLLSVSILANAASLCVDGSRECVMSAAKSYLDALVSHDASRIPMKDDINRWENGVNTGTRADSIRFGLENNPKFHSILGLRDLRWIVDGQQAIVYYLIDDVVPNTEIRVATTHVAERFLVENGKIAEIEAIFCTSYSPESEESKIPQPTGLSIQCNRSG
jgi:hypothetical protein